MTECLVGLCGCFSATIHNIKSHTHTHTQQRISAKHGKLAPARRARLEAVGFVFDGTEARRIRDLATPGVPQLEQCAVHTDVPGADLIGQQQLGEEEEDACPRRNAEGGCDSLDSPHQGAGPDACSVNCGDGDSSRAVAAPVISSPCAPTHAAEVSLQVGTNFKDSGHASGVDVAGCEGVQAKDDEGPLALGQAASGNPANAGEHPEKLNESKQQGQENAQAPQPIRTENQTHHLAAKRQRKQVERIKSSSLRSVQRKPRTPATEDMLDASGPWEAVNQAEQQWPLLKSGSADAVRRARGRSCKHPILDDDQHNQQERMMMQVAQDDLVDQVLHNDVSGEQVQALSSGAGCMGTSHRSHVEACELERMQQRASWIVAAAPHGTAMTGEDVEDTEGVGDKDRGQDKRGSELDVVRKRKSKARPPASEPPKYQKITTNDAAVGSSVTPLGILGGKGGGGGKPHGCAVAV